MIAEVSMMRRTTEHTRIASFRDGDTVGYIVCMECAGTGWWGYGPTLSTNGPCIECKGQGRVPVGLQ